MALHLLLLRVLLLLLSLCAITFIEGQSKPDTAYSPSFKKLDSVKINIPQTRTYAQPVSAGGTKTESPVIDVPQTISSVPRQLMDDKMEFSLSEAIVDLAGINSYSGYDEYTIRGFRAENARNINGLRGYNTLFTSALLVNVESIDVIKGPVAALFGNGDPGGNIDLVTKKPLSATHGEISLFGGSWNQFRGHADVTGPLNQSKSLLYRFNAGYDRSHSFRNGFFSKSFQLAPSFSFVPNDKIRLDVEFSLSHINNILDRGQPALENSLQLKSTPTNLGMTQPGDYLKETDAASIFSFDWKINNHIRFHSGYLNYLTYQSVAEHGLHDYISEDSVDLYFQKWRFNTVTHSLSNYFSFTFNTSMLKHKLLAGYDYISSGVSLGQFRYELPGEFGEGSGVVGTFSLRQPRYIKRNVDAYQLVVGNDNEEGLDADEYHTQGIYFQDQVTYKKFQLLLGLRREFYRTPAEDGVSAITVQNVWSPRMGLVYNILPAMNAYAIYSKGFDPYESSTAVQEFKEPFKPIKSELMEVGLKAGILKNKLNATLAFYQLSLYNVGVNANDPSNPDLYVQRGEDQARGVETEINGNIFSNLSLHLAYAYNIAKVKRSEMPEEIGIIKENAPRHSGNSFIKYDFKRGPLKKFTIMAGHTQVGKRNTLDPQIKLPGYTLLMGGISYDLDDFCIALNVNNITNETYWAGAYNNIYKWPGEPTNFLIRINWKFERKGGE